MATDLQTDSPTQGGRAPASGAKWRSVVSAICMVLAFILLPISIVGFWGQKTLTNTEQFVNTVGPLAAAPEIQQAVATEVSQAVVKQIDVKKYVNDIFGPVLGPKLDAAAAPLEAALETAIDKAALKVMQSPKFEQLWVEAARRLQTAVIKVLEGNNDGPVKESNGKIVLDVAVVVDDVKAELVNRGLTFVKNLPAVPAADSEIVLFDAGQVDQIKMIYALSVPIAHWLIFIAVLLLIAAVALSRRRPRMVIIGGLALVVAGGIIAFGLSFGNTAVASSMQGTVFAAAAAVFYTQLTFALTNAATWSIALGIIAILVGFVIGPWKPAVALRRSVSSLGNRGTGAGGPGGPGGPGVSDAGAGGGTGLSAEPDAQAPAAANT
ncbi:MAG: hypothetical protein WCP28_03500 [Actinomycetes bacterium]